MRLRDLASRREDGVAFPVTLFALTVLALLTAAVAGMTTAEVNSERLVDWDRRALYAAEAGLEHQLFVLQQDQEAGAVGTVSLGGSPLEQRYTVTVQCTPLLSARATCSGEAESRTWEVTSRGQLVQGSTVVHERVVRALVEVRYCGGAPSADPRCPGGGPLYGTPRAVLIRRWEFR